MENDDADVFFNSKRILFAGDMTLVGVGVPKVFAVLLMVVDVERPIDFRFSSSSLFLIFSLIALISCALFGVFSGCVLCCTKFSVNIQFLPNFNATNLDRVITFQLALIKMLQDLQISFVPILFSRHNVLD